MLAARGSRVDLALHIDVPLDELVRRLSGRWICRDAGHVYHEQSNPPRIAGQCDLDGSPLDPARRRPSGDHPGPPDRQLGAMAEVVDHYASTGVLRTIDGVQPIDAVTAALEANLADLTGTGAGLTWSPASRAPRSRRCAGPARSWPKSWT